MFKTYLQLGFEHILDFQGYDHILFIVTLCAIFSIGQWRKLLVLVTAFTLGHSLTLALSALSIVTIDAGLVEFLIPLTILLTAVYNRQKRSQQYVHTLCDDLFIRSYPWFRI